MKKIFSIVTFLLVANTLIAQAPLSFKYQAVLRDARGNTRANTSVVIGIDLLQGSASGISVYRETHNVTTDSFGLINIEIGKGTASIGSLSAVNWSAGPYFIRVIVDGLEMGTSQLLSVPYALYAKTAGNGFSGSYNDLTAKPALFDGTWSSLTGRPAFATVATTGSYTDLKNKPVIFSGDYASLTGKPTLSLVASTGSYTSLINKPVLFDGAWANLTGKPTTVSGFGITDAVTSIGDQIIDGNKTFTGTINASNKVVKNVATPVNANDAVNKDYVDSRIEYSVSRTGDTLYMGSKFLIITGISDANTRRNKLPWQNTDSVKLSQNLDLLTANNSNIFLINQNRDTVFIMDINSLEIVCRKAISVTPYSIVKENVFINPISEYSFDAYDITDIKNWILIQNFSGLDKGILYWQWLSSLFADNFYYWIGHWNQTVQIFAISGNTITQYNKFNVGVNSQCISRYNNFLFVASNYSNNKKIDISDLNSPINLGDFGNSRSDANYVISAGVVLQNHRQEWGGELSNLKTYNQNNEVLSLLEGYIAPTNSIFFTLPNGYLIFDQGAINVYNINNGNFSLESTIPAYSRIYNDKYLIAKTGNSVYLINRK